MIEMTRNEHALLRRGMLTGSRVQRLMVGGHRAWNTIAREMRDPPPFFDLESAPNMPASLAWGQLQEGAACAEFWERHPEYDLDNPRFLSWHDPAQTELQKYLAFSPDRMLRPARPFALQPAVHLAYSAGLEVKCPYNGTEHIENVKASKLPERYKWQVYHGMYVSGLTEWWLVSFDSRVTDPDWRYHERHIVAEEPDMRLLHDKIFEFLDGYTSGREFQPKSLKAADYDRMFP